MFPEKLKSLADTYSQLYVHVIFAVKRREAVLHATWRRRLFAYLIGIARGKGESIVAINGMPDHVHILFRVRPTTMLADLVRDVKANSSKWLNGSGLVDSQFAWQHGFGAFSVSPHAVNRIKAYIDGQEEHHHNRSFRQEYQDLLECFGDYREQHFFEEME